MLKNYVCKWEQIEFQFSSDSVLGFHSSSLESITEVFSMQVDPDLANRKLGLFACWEKKENANKNKVD